MAQVTYTSLNNVIDVICKPFNIEIDIKVYKM